MINQLLSEILIEYPEISQARLLFKQRKYNESLEIYSEILNKMNIETVNKIKQALIYLEYSKLLLLSNDKVILNPELEEDQEYLEDIEIAWELLEIAKGVFKENNLKEQLLHTYTLLCDISEDSNNLEILLEDLQEGIKLSEEIDKEREEKMISESTAELLIRLSNTYTLQENKQKALEVLKNINIDKVPNAIKENILERINELESNQNEKIKYQAPEINPNQPVHKLNLKKK
ncbi:hypothetical protein NEOKW01_0543 [Nematocida sp. AWRm80]|nr:hypothetical protein NEOKW01_0543 [Nematocida sp. AWRm80]